MHNCYILAFSEQETSIDEALKIYDIHGYGLDGSDGVDFHDHHEEVESEWADIQSGKAKTEQTFKTIDEYAKANGYVRNEDGRFGRLFNWDGLYDYYKIGGFFDGRINGKNIVTYDEFVEWLKSPAFNGVAGFILGSIDEDEMYDTPLNGDDIELCRQNLLEMVDNLYDKPEYWKFAVIDMHN
jgi:hypothetical protein